MGERHSEYERVDGENYWTPEWVYTVLFSAEEFHGASDVAPRVRVDGYDFLEDPRDFTEIATNPPYKLATEFCRHALERTEVMWGKVAMLLPMAFDTAKTRRDLFEHPAFKSKLVITTRIRWENLDQKKAGPSSNHAWFVWDWNHEGPPTIRYLPLKKGPTLCQPKSKEALRLSSLHRRKQWDASRRNK